MDFDSFRVVYLRLDQHGRFFLKRSVGSELEIDVNEEFISFLGDKVLILPFQKHVEHIETT